MRLSFSDVEADTTLPDWMLDERYPDWLRDTKYRHITEVDYCAALMEVRRGFRDQRSFDSLISSRKSTAKMRVKKKAAQDAMSPEEKTSKDLRRKQAQRLARLKSIVEARQRRLAASIDRWGESNVVASGERQQLQWAREAFDRYVTQAIAKDSHRCHPKCSPSIALGPAGVHG